MSISSTTALAAPFDSAADTYDATFTESKIGRTQRAVVWQAMAKAFKPGDRVLEVGCGTGVDACFLADRGVRVMACDSSPRMLALAQRKAVERKHEDRIQFRCIPGEFISSLRGERLFDGAISNFGALNCVEDLAAFAESLADLMRVGSTALLCLMGPCCAWEIGWYLGRGNLRKAFRRFQRRGITAQLSGNALVHVNYPSLRQLRRQFAPHFRLRSFQGVGVAVPPSYAESWVAKSPWWFEAGVQADKIFGRLPGLRLLADHVLLEFERIRGTR